MSCARTSTVQFARRSVVPGVMRSAICGTSSRMSGDGPSFDDCCTKHVGKALKIHEPCPTKNGAGVATNPSFEFPCAADGGPVASACSFQPLAANRCANTTLPNATTITAAIA
ncbi:MAG: hypothetical protein M3N49_07180 [Candidatus Eremiobacteraeota bacterium]|nr:hypothetical protein [Candidatus Eremiobacteraeota bacterium]